MATFKRQTGSGWEHISLPVNIGMSPQTLAYAQVTANQGSITTEVDLTGLSVTVVVPEGRRLRISGDVYLQNTAAGNQQSVVINKNGAQIQSSQLISGAVSNPERISVTVIDSPAAGTHTYKLRAVAAAGTSAMIAGATFPNFILVEDITGSTLPYQPASVPVGRLGYAEITSTYTIGATGTATVIPGLSVNVAVPAGRVLKLTAFVHLRSTVTTDQCYVGLQQDGSGLGFAYLNETAASPNTTPIVQIVSPTAGSHTYTVLGHRQIGTGSLTVYADSLSPSWIMVEDITPTPAPSSGAPGSTLAYAEVTANQGSITTGTDLTGLSVAVTVPAGRRLRISGKVLFSNTAADNRSSLLIYQDGVQVQAGGVNHSEAAREEVCELSVVLSPASGSHTYKLQAAPDAGTTTMTAGANHPAFILVEDITGSVWPEGSAVTAGMVASEPWTDYVPTLTQSGAVTKTVTYARYMRIGRMITVEGSLTITGAGTGGIAVIIGLPVAAAASAPAGLSLGMGKIGDASTGLAYRGIVELLGAGGSTVGLIPTTGTNNNYLGAVDFTAALASGDAVVFNATYEAAS